MGFLNMLGAFSSMVGNGGSGIASMSELGLLGGDKEEREEMANYSEMAGGLGEVGAGITEGIEGFREHDTAGGVGGILGGLSGLFTGGSAAGKQFFGMKEKDAGIVKGVGGLLGMGSGAAGLVSAYQNRHENDGTATTGKTVSGIGSIIKGLGSTVSGFGASDEKAKKAGSIISLIGAATGFLGNAIGLFGGKKKTQAAAAADATDTTNTEPDNAVQDADNQAASDPDNE